HAYLKLDVRSLRRLLSADRADELSRFDLLPDGDVHRLQVEIQRAKAAAVAHDDSRAIARERTGELDLSALDSRDRRARGRADPDAVVPQHDPVRLAVRAEAVDDVAVDRPPQRSEIASRDGSRPGGRRASRLVRNAPTLEVGDGACDALLLTLEFGDAIRSARLLTAHLRERRLPFTLDALDLCEFQRPILPQQVQLLERFAQVVLLHCEVPFEPLNLLEHHPVVQRHQVEVLVPCEQVSETAG